MHFRRGASISHLSVALGEGEHDGRVAVRVIDAAGPQRVKHTDENGENGEHDERDPARAAAALFLALIYVLCPNRHGMPQFRDSMSASFAMRRA